MVTSSKTSADSGKNSSKNQSSTSRRKKGKQSVTGAAAPMAVPAAVTLTAAAVRRQQKEQKYKGKNDEEILAEQMKTWRSQAYNHFQPPIIVVEDGKILYKFVCKKNPSIFCYHEHFEDLTGNLNDHIKVCNPEAPVGQGTIDNFASGSRYSAAKFRFKLDMWCARRHRPHRIVRDPELVDAFQMLYAKVDIPSPTTVSRDIREMYDITKACVAASLQATRGRLHFGIDGWTSPNVISYLGITVTRVNEGKLEEFVLDYIPCSDSHTGEYMAKQLIKVLDEFGIRGRGLGLVVDGAAPNGVLADKLALEVNTFRGCKYRVRCLDHIWVLVTKGFLKQFSHDPKKVKDSDFDELLDDDVSEEEGDHDDKDKQADDPDQRGHDDAILDSLDFESEVDMDESKPAVTAAEAKLGRFAIFKMTQLGKKAFNNAILKATILQACEEHNIKPTVLIRAVVTRWNTVSDMLQRGIDLKDVLNHVCDSMKFNKGPTTLRLRRFLLLEDEWTVLQQCSKYLQAFKDLTKDFSYSNKPLIYEVFPAIDKLTQKLEHGRDSICLHPAVHLACWNALIVLNNYYSKTDESHIHRTALIMHPSQKTQYFLNQKWEATWIEEAMDIVRDEWAFFKWHCWQGTEASATQTAQTSRKQRKRYDWEDDTSDEEDVPADLSPAAADPLEHYLHIPILPNIKDPLTFWASQNPANDPLAQFALNFLLVPATSVNCERYFSAGSQNVSRFRHSLLDKSIRATTVLGSWASVGLVPEDEIIQGIWSKGPHWRIEEEGPLEEDIENVDSDGSSEIMEVDT